MARRSRGAEPGFSALLKRGRLAGWLAGWLGRYSKVRICSLVPSLPTRSTRSTFRRSQSIDPRSMPLHEASLHRGSGCNKTMARRAPRRSRHVRAAPGWKQAVWPLPLARISAKPKMATPKRKKRRGSAATKSNSKRTQGPMSLPLVTLRLKRPAEPAAPAAARECKPRVVAAPPSEELAAANALRGLFAAAPPAPAPAAASAQSKRVLSMVRPSPRRPPVTPPVASRPPPTSAPYPHPSLARRPSSSPRTTS